MGRDHIKGFSRKLPRAAHGREILRLVDGDAARFAALLLHGVSRLMLVGRPKCAVRPQDARLDGAPVRLGSKAGGGAQMENEAESVAQRAKR